MPLFPKKIYEVLDHDSHSEIFAFYTDVSKAFDNVPHYELIQKLIDIEVGGCLHQILIWKIDNNMCVWTIQVWG